MTTIYETNDIPLEKQKHFLENYLDALVVTLLFFSVCIVALPNLYTEYFVPELIEIDPEDAVVVLGINFSYYFYEFYLFAEQNLSSWIHYLHFTKAPFWIFSVLSCMFWVTYFFIPLPFIKLPFVPKDNLHNRRRGTHKKLHIALYLTHLDKSFKKINKIDFKKFMRNMNEEVDEMIHYPLFVNDLMTLYKDYGEELKIIEEDKYILGISSEVQSKDEITANKLICTNGHTLNQGLNVQGPTGSGKSLMLRSICLQHTLKGLNTMMIDGKGTIEDIRTLNALVSNPEYGNGEFRLISLVEDCETYNVLWIDSDKITLENLAEVFFSLWDGQKSSEYYYNMSQSYYDIYIRALIACGQPYNVNDLKALFSSPTQRKDFFKRFSQTPGQEFTFSQIKAEYAALTQGLSYKETPESVCSGFIAFLNKWTSPKYNS